MEIETQYRPPRPLRPGELWDVCSGKFIASLSESTGCTRKIAIEPHNCMMCSRRIGIGEEYEEDLALICARCTDKDRTERFEPNVWRGGDLVRALWHPFRVLLTRAITKLRYKPPHIHLPQNLTWSDLLRIQPEIIQYCRQLHAEGPPWDTLSVLLRELNAMAMLTPEYLERLEQIRMDLTEASSLLRDPIDFASKKDHEQIYLARSYVASARNKVMKARHVLHHNR